jgi:cyclophilin family peptidyl-prolyl cis-trans isomerase
VLQSVEIFARLRAAGFFATRESSRIMAPRRKASSILAGIVLGLGFCAFLSSRGSAAQQDDQHPVIILDTSKGAITLELDKEKAPITVENFLKYVDSGFYDNLIFHRVIRDFMVQGGGFDSKLNEKREGQRGEIKNESGNGLSNKRGTIAMARRNDPNSAQNQFFINVKDNERLDTLGGGYTVFGKVIDGMDVADKIREVKTSVQSGMADVPVEPIVIKSAKRKEKK